MMSKAPAAFMSYVRDDDAHDNGRLTLFRERLASELRMQSGEEFHIFQDRNDIAWGQQWKERIDGSLDAVTFLIPIITPAFFKRPACREELARFLDRESRLKRNDLVLPIYYVGKDVLEDEARRQSDPLVAAIASRQFADWRELRFEPFTSPSVGRTLATMALQIIQALNRGQAPAPASPSDGKDSRPAAAPASSPVEEPPKAATQPPRDSDPSPRAEPRTRVVDAFHRGDHVSLTEALQAAQPGDRILVRPGTYYEGVVIDKVVEIIGDGEVGDIVIAASGKDAILFKASMGRIVNLTLRQTGGGKFYGIDIAQGRVDIEGCDLSSQSNACVAIHGGADPRLRRNRIHDGKSAGVFIYDNGQGTLEDNDIFANTLAGVEIKQGGAPTLRRNRIRDGKAGGVYVWDSGQGTLEDNDIFTNTLAGVEIKQGSAPTLRRNRIHDGKSGGVFVWDNGQGTLEDNDIFANTLAGVAIRESGAPTLRRNRIHDGKQGGVFVYENGQGTLEDNDIFANASAGVEIKQGSAPTLRRNRIHDGKSVGVHVWENGQGTLEDNDIFANASAGVEIKQGGAPTLRRNRITGNEYQGVWVYDGGKGIIEDNDLRKNKRGAWNLAADCVANVKRARNQE